VASRRAAPRISPLSEGSSDEVCARLREKIGPAIGLSYSNGKDSIGAWIQLRKFFEDVRPVYRYLIPGLRFIEEDLARYEEQFATKIVRIPCEFFTTWLDDAAFCGPRRTALLAKATFLRGGGARHYLDIGLASVGLAGGWSADGWRRGDSMGRAIYLKRHGAADEEDKIVSPVFDWSDKRLEQELIAAKVQLPVDYFMFGRSFDWLRAKYLGPIRRHYPDDWERIKFWFPLVEAELLRYRESTGQDA